MVKKHLHQKGKNTIPTVQNVENLLPVLPVVKKNLVMKYMEIYCP